MTLQELFDKAFAEGVDHIVVHDMFRDDYTHDAAWFWEIHQGEPITFKRIIKPWAIGFQWLGFGSNPNKLFDFFPFEISFWDWWIVGVYTGSKRMGWQASERETLAEGLRAALGMYLCEGQGTECEHVVCEYHGTEYCDVDF